MKKTASNSRQEPPSASVNKENVHPLQAHYQQYLMQQLQYQHQQQQRESLQPNQQSQTESRISQGALHYQSSDLSLSQSAVSHSLNQDMNSGPVSINGINSNRSSHQPQKKKTTPGVQGGNQTFNSNSSKGTPSFNYGQKIQKSANNGSAVTLRVQQSSKQQTTIKKPVIGVPVVNQTESNQIKSNQTDFLHRQYQKNVHPYQHQQLQTIQSSSQYQSSSTSSLNQVVSNGNAYNSSYATAINHQSQSDGAGYEHYSTKKLKQWQGSSGGMVSHQSSSNKKEGLLSSTNKHLCFDSLQNSSSPSHNQVLSHTSNNYIHGLISGSSESQNLRLRHQDYDQEDDLQTPVCRASSEMEAEEIMGENSSKKMITLNNSLLDCVDQYGNQYSVLIDSDHQSSSPYSHEKKKYNKSGKRGEDYNEFNSVEKPENQNRDSDSYHQVFSDGDNEQDCFKDFEEIREDDYDDNGLLSSNKKQYVSELNNPNSFIHAITKALQEDGVYTVKQMGSVISNGNGYGGINTYNPASNGSALNNGVFLASGPNFVVCCSPSQNTCNNDDDCQYTNSSAARSAVALSIKQNSKTSTAFQRRQREQRLIYTDEERKEEDLSSEAIDEEQTQVNEWVDQQQDQFTGDNDEDETESRMKMITGSSQIAQTRDQRHYEHTAQRGGIVSLYSSSKTPSDPTTTDHKFVQVLDSDSRIKLRAMNDTPQMMQMIDQSNMKFNSGESASALRNPVGDQLSPEVLGSRENRRRRQKDNGARNSSRYLNFKDISPLVKSCNTFDIVSGLGGGMALREGPGVFGSTANEYQLRGKISLQQQNHYPSVVRDQPKVLLIQGEDIESKLEKEVYGQGLTFMNTMSAGGPNANYGPQFFQTIGTFVQTESNKGNGLPQKYQMASPDTIATNKLSSMLESPPPVTENTPDKGIKDFNREYLGRQGMWPSKLNNAGNTSTLNVSQSVAVRDPRNDSYSTKLSNKLEALEAIHSSQQNQQQQTFTKSQKKTLVPPLQISNLMFSTADRTQQTSTMQSNPTQDRVQAVYPNIDLSIVQKINSTIDNSGLQFYFKRPSDHVGIGNSSINNLRTSRDQSLSKNNASQMMSNPGQMGNTLFNAINQSSFDDLCTIQCDNNMTSTLHQENSNLQPMTSRSNLQHQNNFVTNITTRFSNLSGAQQVATDTQRILNVMNNSHQIAHNKLNLANNAKQSCCSNCHFEKEKRTITQKAFERALGISLFLMEEIDKLNVKDVTKNDPQQSMQISRQEIVNLLKGSNTQTQSKTTKGFLSPYNAASNMTALTNDRNNTQTRFSRSKSQSMMPMEFANLQRSLQIPRGGIFQNPTPNNMSYV